MSSAPPRHIVAASGLVRNQAGQILLERSVDRGWEIPAGQGEVIYQAYHAHPYRLVETHKA